jgi:hypothetical protein
MIQPVYRPAQNKRQVKGISPTKIRVQGIKKQIKEYMEICNKLTKLILDKPNNETVKLDDIVTNFKDIKQKLDDTKVGLLLTQMSLASQREDLNEIESRLAVFDIFLGQLKRILIIKTKKTEKPEDNNIHHPYVYGDRER